MGDLRTHETIASAVIDELKSALPEDDYIFFHLGNWLTDMSQFRDWPAYSQAKISIWKAVSDTEGFEGFAVNVGNMRHLYLHLNEYLDALFGGQNGYLWRWCNHLVYVMGLNKFKKKGVSSNQFESLFDSYWTQYFPHEHLDFPPQYHNTLGDRTTSSFAKHHCDINTPAGGNRHFPIP